MHGADLVGRSEGGPLRFWWHVCLSAFF